MTMQLMEKVIYANYLQIHSHLLFELLRTSYICVSDFILENICLQWRVQDLTWGRYGGARRVVPLVVY